MRDNVFSNLPRGGLAGQIDDLAFGVVDVIWGTGNEAAPYLEEFSDSLSIGDEPGLDLSYGYAEAHERSRVWQPDRERGRGAGKVVVEIEEHGPMTVPCRVVVASETSEYEGLAALAVDVTNVRSSGSADGS